MPNPEADIVNNQVKVRGYSDEYTKEYIKKDGTVFPISIRVWMVHDQQGRQAGMWGIVRDITERKRAEEDLERSLDKLRQTMERTVQAMP